MLFVEIDQHTDLDEQCRHARPMCDRERREINAALRSEARKYKLRLVLACQSLGQVDGRHNRADVGHSIIANVANLIAFRLGVENAYTLSRWFAPGFGVEDMLYLPNHTAVARLLANGQALRPIEFGSLPPPGIAVEVTEGP